jgi:hypothetical protein
MFSKQPPTKPFLTFDLRHIPQKQREEIETTVTLGVLENDTKLTGCELSCAGGPGFFMSPNTYHIEQALNQYYAHLGAKTYMAVGGIRIIVDNPNASDQGHSPAKENL